MNVPTQISYPVAVVGDVHGYAKPLDDLLRAVERESPNCSLAFVGDFVDRGPNPRKVVERVAALVREGRATAVRGNHDHALVRAAGLDGKPASAWWASRYCYLYDAASTLRSYVPGTAGLDARDVLDMVGRAMPDSHREFLASLPWGVTTAPPECDAGHLIVHGGLSRRLRLDAREQMAALLGRSWCPSMACPDTAFQPHGEYPAWLGADREAARDPLPLTGWVQVVGHERVARPVELGHAIRIDTSGGSPAPLSACVLDGPGCKPRFVNSAR